MNLFLSFSVYNLYNWNHFHVVSFPLIALYHYTAWLYVSLIITFSTSFIIPSLLLSTLIPTPPTSTSIFFIFLLTRTYPYPNLPYYLFPDYLFPYHPYLFPTPFPFLSTFISFITFLFLLLYKSTKLRNTLNLSLQCSLKLNRFLYPNWIWNK